MEGRQAYASLRSRNPNLEVEEAPGYPSDLNGFNPPSYGNLTLNESSVMLFQEFADHASEATAPFASFLGNATPLSEAPRHAKAAVNAGLRALEAARAQQPLAPEILTLDAQVLFWDVANVSVSLENVHSITGQVSPGSASVTFTQTAPGFSPIVPSVVTEGHAVVEGLQEALETTLTVTLTEGGLHASSGVAVTTPALDIQTSAQATHDTASLSFLVVDPRLDYALEVQGKPTGAASWTPLVPEASANTAQDRAFTATFPGLAENTQHDVRYRAVRNGVFTAYRTLQVSTTELPGAVTALSFAQSGLRGIDVTWASPVSVPPVESFNVVWEYTSAGYPVSDSRTGTQTDTVTTSSYSISGLNYDSAVRITVSANNSNGNGPQEQLDAQTTATSAPPTPSAPLFSSHTEDSLMVSYTHVVHEPEVQTYNVIVTDPSGQAAPFTHVHPGGALGTIQLTGLTAGPDKLYTVSVAAVNTTGASDPSPELQAYTADLAAPQVASVTYQTSPENVTVAFSGVSDNSGGAVSTFAFLTDQTLDAAGAQAATELPGYNGAAGLGDGTLACTTLFNGTGFEAAVPNTQYTLHALAVDRVGNFDHRVFYAVAIADDVPPTVSASLTSASSSGVTVAGTFGDDYSFPVSLTSALLTGAGALSGTPSAVSNSGGVSSQSFTVSFSQAWDGTQLVPLRPGIQANVTLVAEDGSGNTFSQVVPVDIPDTTPPVLSASGDAGATQVSYTVTASDDSGGTPTLSVFLSAAQQTAVPSGFTGVATDYSGALTTAYGMNPVGVFPISQLGTTFNPRGAL